MGQRLEVNTAKSLNIRKDIQRELRSILLCRFEARNKLGLDLCVVDLLHFRHLVVEVAALFALVNFVEGVLVRVAQVCLAPVGLRPQGLVNTPVVELQVLLKYTKSLQAINKVTAVMVRAGFRLGLVPQLLAQRAGFGWG